ncbi:3',5'-cyclic AMP phosphodiesterase CpdA [Rhodoglobus vestalii]|uniref:3',5'-cyclic AMP phosphodiesterase CpdA n=1 Tax=Rhodoglobus vestalii TaxID=193384 RepID=A0A8H2K7V7_9MICO|nr:phosphodiesterase [Rhodoglobus vestalii]TQO20519.1 3',5'-cyclic AMP phosphodiesterase CpdA [Rhodoglobus vestalii]
MTGYESQYPRPEHFLLHLSDTHFLAGERKLYNTLDSEVKLQKLFSELEASGSRPEAIIFTGDLADKGEPDAYRLLKAIVEPAAERLGAEVVWVMGNHDDRSTFATVMLDEPASEDPIDRVIDINGLRIITLDSTVPGHHYGHISDAQLLWLHNVLATPAPHGTILAMHHPPVPSMLDLAVTVELRAQQDLAAVIRGSDIRSIIAGHLHYSTTATFAGIPVSVASATCYTQDLNVAVGGSRSRDGAQSFNLVHVYDETVLHSVVPLGEYDSLSYVTPEQTAAILAQHNITIAPATNPRVVPSIVRV